MSQTRFVKPIQAGYLSRVVGLGFFIFISIGILKARLILVRIG